jgi:hypothetical protein
MTYTDTKWAERLNYLAAVEDGWYDGEGEAINPDVLNIANTILSSLDSATFHLPALFPLLGDDTNEGGILMEWVERGNNPNHRYHINLEITNSFVYEVYVFNLANHEMAFLETESVDEANEFLRTNLIRVGFVFSTGDVK